MRSKYLFYAMAASLALAGCSNEEFGYEGNEVSKEDRISTQDLNLVFTKADAQTRAQWDETKDNTLKFYWTSKSDAIGMVYTGQGGTVGLTNYNFVADSLKFDETQVELKAEDQLDKSKATDLFYPISDDGMYNITLGQGDYVNYKSVSGFTGDLTLGKSVSAKFKTTNDYLLKGYYVAYYPLNEKWENAGELIPVESPKEIEIGGAEQTPQANDAILKENLKAVGEKTYSYSKPAEVAHGRQVTEFALQNLSSALRIRIANEGELEDAKSLKTVVLRAKGNDAFVVKGKLNNPSAAPAASVINVDATEGRTATLFARYKNNYHLTLAEGKKADADKTKRDTVDVYFPVLPTTFASDGIEVILIGEDNMACVLEAKFSKETGATLGAGKRLNLYTKVAKDTKFDQAFITTADDLQTAINNAKQQSTPTTINLLGDIESTGLSMVSDNTGTDVNQWKGGVTITASTGSKLTLENPSICLFNTEEKGKQPVWLTINAPLAIKGNTSSIQGSVAMNGETTIEGKLAIGHASANGHYAGQLAIGGKTTIKAGATVTARYSKGVTIKKGGELVIEESNDTKKVAHGIFINDNWKYDESGDKQYKSDLIIEGTMTVNGILVDGGDTQINGGKLVVNGTATNWNTMNVNGGTIEVNGTFNNEKAGETQNKLAKGGNVKIATGTLTISADGKIYNKESLNCAGTFTNNGTFYDYVGSVYGGNPYTSNGTYACYVNSMERLNEAYRRLNLVAKDKSQKIILQHVEDTDKVAFVYNLNSESAAKVNFENEGDVRINGVYGKGTKDEAVRLINSLTVNEGEVTIVGSINIAGATIAGKTVKPVVINENSRLTIENDLEVKVNGAIENNAKGVFNLKNAEKDTNLPATVYCKSANVRVGVWENYPSIYADGSFWE